MGGHLRLWRPYVNGRTFHKWLAEIISFRGNYVHGNTRFVAYCATTLQIYCYQQSSQAKNLPDTEKTGDR